MNVHCCHDDYSIWFDVMPINRYVQPCHLNWVAFNLISPPLCTEVHDLVLNLNYSGEFEIEIKK